MIFSLVLLFSVFLFMGTSESSGCFSCDNGKNASFQITNASGAQQKVAIAGPTAKELIVGIGKTNTVTVKPGQYVVSSKAAPYYNSLYYSQSFTLIEGAVAGVYIE